MTTVSWPENIPTKFFSGNDKPKENTQTTSFLSGRQVSWRTNTKNLMTYKVRLELTHAELALFWTWFNDTLGQNANAFTCSALGDSVYKFISVPEPQDTDQRTRVLAMEIEEV